MASTHFTTGTTITSEWLNDVNDAVYEGNITAEGVQYTPPFTGGVTETVEAKLAQTVSVKDFGAVGDGVTDDTDAIQNAIDAISVTGGTIVFPPGTYLVRRTVGVNDHWGLKITTNGITLQGNQATLKRFDTDITANALAYPIIFVGTPDSNTANATENAVIQGFNFVGENTRHSQSGVDRADFRTAIAAKNTKNLVVQNNVFTKIDSSVIYYQRPVTFDYTNSVYYNTTKNYNSKFISNTCIAESHAVAGRALIHAISANGIDGLTAEGNSFEWCDVAISTDTTYDFGTVETNTYIPTVSGWTLGAVKRTGRNVVFNNNRCYNGTEHPIYLSGFEEVACNNTIYSDVPTLTATNDAIKIRSLGCSIVGNNISGYGAGVNAAPAANNVTIQGNSINIPQENNTQLGAITVSSEGLSTYIAARITEGYWSVYRPMTAISVCGNSISFPETNSTGGSFIRHIGLSVRSDDASNVNFPLGMLQGVVFDGNSIANHKTGVYIVGNQAKNISITGNSFVGKPFDPTSFLQSSAMLTYGTLVSDKTSAAQLQQYKFSGNSVFGTKYLFAAYDGSGTADFYNLPWGVQANRLDYVQYLKTTNMSPVAIYTRFAENTGLYFMDRTWLGNGLNNSLSDGNSNSEYRYCLRYVSSEVRFYTADDGSYIVLG